MGFRPHSMSSPLTESLNACHAWHPEEVAERSRPCSETNVLAPKKIMLYSVKRIVFTVDNRLTTSAWTVFLFSFVQEQSVASCGAVETHAASFIVQQSERTLPPI